MANLETSLKSKVKYFYYINPKSVYQRVEKTKAGTTDRNERNSLDSTQMHNTDDYGCFDEKQYEEIHHLSQESLER